MSVSGGYAASLILMNSRQGKTYLAGSYQSNTNHWDSFNTKGSCLTGVYGLTANGTLLSLGMYFNSQIQPTG